MPLVVTMQQTKLDLHPAQPTPRPRLWQSVQPCQTPAGASVLSAQLPLHDALLFQLLKASIAAGLLSVLQAETRKRLGSLPFDTFLGAAPFIDVRVAPVEPVVFFSWLLMLLVSGTIAACCSSAAAASPPAGRSSLPVRRCKVLFSDLRYQAVSMYACQ